MSIRILIDSISSHTPRLHAVTLYASACAVCDCYSMFISGRLPLRDCIHDVRFVCCSPVIYMLSLWWPIQSESIFISGRAISSALLRLPTLPPLPDLMIAAVVVVYVGSLFFPSFIGGYCRGLVFTAWHDDSNAMGHSPMYDSRLTSTHHSISNGGCKKWQETSRLLPPSGGCKYYCRQFWNASKLPYSILTWLLRHITRKL